MKHQRIEVPATIQHDGPLRGLLIAVPASLLLWSLMGFVLHLL